MNGEKVASQNFPKKMKTIAKNVDLVNCWMSSEAKKCRCKTFRAAEKRVSAEQKIRFQSGHSHRSVREESGGAAQSPILLSIL